MAEAVRRLPLPLESSLAHHRLQAVVHTLGPRPSWTHLAHPVGLAFEAQAAAVGTQQPFDELGSRDLAHARRRFRTPAFLRRDAHAAVADVAPLEVKRLGEPHARVAADPED